MTDDSPYPPEEQDLLERLAALPPVPPRHDAAARFATRRRHASVTSPARRWPWPLAIAATLALILGAGWYRERQVRLTERAAMHERFARAMQDLSAATRYLAISTVTDSVTPDSAMIGALQHALLHDASTSVRVAAAEALGRIADPAAFVALARLALATEESPFVHAVMLRTAAGFDSTRRHQMAALLLGREDLDPVLRAQAEGALVP